MKSFGYIPSVVDSTHWQFGASSVPKDILQADGDWSAYLPQFESQAINFETDACTIFGTGHATTILMKKLFGEDFDYAERYTYNIVGINPPIGTDPHVVAEAIRKNGLINQNYLPMTQTLEEYKTPRPMTTEYLAEGQQWLTEHTFNHEWVFSNNPPKEVRLALLKEALMYSPLCISVTAWHGPINGMYEDMGQPNCHWVVCYALDGDTPLVFDSYSQDGSPLKRLHPDHHIEVCKRYYIGPNGTETQKENWFTGFFKALFQSLGIIQKEVNNLPKKKI